MTDPADSQHQSVSNAASIDAAMGMSAEIVQAMQMWQRDGGLPISFLLAQLGDPAMVVGPIPRALDDLTEKARMRAATQELLCRRDCPFPPEAGY